MAELFVLKADLALPLAALDAKAKRWKYAIANTLNNTAAKIQEAERAHAQQVFKVRAGSPKGPSWFLRQVAVRTFASAPKNILKASVKVGGKNMPPDLLLPGYEEGAPRLPFKGKHVAVPLTGGAARPSITSSIPAALTFKGMRLVKAKKKGEKRSRRRKANLVMIPHVSKSGEVQWKGKHRTFILLRTAKAPLGGVYQRVGPSKDDVRMIYSFAEHVRLKAILDYIKTGRRIVDRMLALELKRQIALTLRHQLFG